MAAQQAGEVFPGVVVDPAVHHGVPVLAGTRIAVQTIIELLAAGDSVETVTEAYHLTPEQVRAALGYAADRLASETVYALATPQALSLPQMPPPRSRVFPPKRRRSRNVYSKQSERRRG